MLLQGDLQRVFDALYSLGVIDPVLKMDWQESIEEMIASQDLVNSVIRKVNSTNGDHNFLAKELHKFDEKSLKLLAMEVAREYAEFHSRNALH